MKIFSIIFAAFVAIGAALPQQVAELDDDATRQSRFVTDTITGIIEGVSESIRERGLDPFNLEEFRFGYSPLPVNNLLDISANVLDVLVIGVSNIVINRMSFGLLTQRLTYDISIPQIVISVGSGQVDVVVLNERLSGHGNGKVVIKDIGVKGRVRISIGGAITGNLIRDLEIAFYMGSIDSQIEVLNLLGVDIAREMNHLINDRVYGAVMNSENEINELLEMIAWQLINELL